MYVYQVGYITVLLCLDPIDPHNIGPEKSTPSDRLKFLDGQGDNGCPCEFSWKITVLKQPEFDEQELPGTQPKKTSSPLIPINYIYIYIWVNDNISLT